MIERALRVSAALVVGAGLALGHDRASGGGDFQENTFAAPGIVSTDGNNAASTYRENPDVLLGHGPFTISVKVSNEINEPGTWFDVEQVSSNLVSVVERPGQSNNVGEINGVIGAMDGVCGGVESFEVNEGGEQASALVETTGDDCAHSMVEKIRNSSSQ